MIWVDIRILTYCPLLFECILFDTIGISVPPVSETNVPSVEEWNVLVI